MCIQARTCTCTGISIPLIIISKMLHARAQRSVIKQNVFRRKTNKRGQEEQSQSKETMKWNRKRRRRKGNTVAKEGKERERGREVDA